MRKNAKNTHIDLPTHALDKEPTPEGLVIDPPVTVESNVPMPIDFMRDEDPFKTALASSIQRAGRRLKLKNPMELVTDKLLDNALQDKSIRESNIAIGTIAERISGRVRGGNEVPVVNNTQVILNLFEKLGDGT